MANSRYDKYKKIREGIKDGAGINREVDSSFDDLEDDDFLSFMKKDKSKVDQATFDVNDTLTEAKTFEQMREESSVEIDKALKSAKEGVGKEAKYNTRMDILNKIRDSEKEVIHVDSLDNVDTENFARGMFVSELEKQSHDEEPQPKKNISLMERLSQMSNKEKTKPEVQVETEVTDSEEESELVKTDIRVFGNSSAEEDIEENEVTKVMKNTGSIEDMLTAIKKKDAEEVKKVTNQEPEPEKEKKSTIEKILNGVIILLIIVFIILCVLIVLQITQN